MNSPQNSSFDKAAFFSNFSGMEDLAYEAIQSFLASLPDLIAAVFESIQSKSPEKLELTAHTLKGSVSNFHAVAAKDLAFELEKMGKNKTMDDAVLQFEKMCSEFEKLKIDLQQTLNNRTAA